jgi:hypothetical protein
MNKKNKASKLISTAMGLIVILAVILCSPLFGYGRGLAPKEQREAAAAAEPGFSTGYVAAPQAAASATPRPTAQPTPAPVVLPSAPPVPDPTPEPTRPPSRPAAAQQPVQQAAPAQQEWIPEEAAEGEGEYGESSEETPAESAEMPANTIGIGEEITTTEDGGQYIATQNADIVINTGAADSGGAEQSYESSNNPPTQEFVPDSSEAEAFTIG